MGKFNMTWRDCFPSKSFLFDTTFKRTKIKTKRNKILCKFYVLSGITDIYITVSYTIPKHIRRTTTNSNDFKHEFNIMSGVLQNSYDPFVYNKYIDDICEVNLMKPIRLYVQPQYIKIIQITIMNAIYKEVVRLMGV